ncbi:MULTISPECIES: GNAT family N-acetyltransferase [Alicyclobacillus]|uniref:GNAT family N-acetyltransferase n=1 Tax=Alicyclobacillus acidoterrestris (strain ATCC 49025 / DSM 3922 / CIP 106132 / NCIMB 13137 / GD3B) TaxID=1356854 RepID=T0CU22_ALIAG|nr:MULTISPECIES: GNAT family N-acetyltransferase [Alicyclobacillus]EPZ41046.1 hypothetical protein N007_17625 [Alicyclobacillus acidoterrestris ATCC 49025]UNO47792.1 GNAT family N-acetyltransferase [Alicyclobacillus acidoterrestris]GEO27205.1 N-acetyltransferase [Alicyclobacillus acidoterrestris]
MKVSPVIRKYRSADATYLQEIDRLTWHPAVSPAPSPTESLEVYRRHLQTRMILVAKVEDEVVGYIGLAAPTCLLANRHVWLIDIAVHPKMQRQGIATALLHAAEVHARMHHVYKLSLRVLETNQGARALYERVGFVEEGRLRNEFFIEGNFVDDIWMSKWTGT